MARTAWAAIVALVVTAVVAEAGTKAGMHELQVQGALSLQTNDENEDKNYTATATFIYNYFFAPQVSVGVSSMLVGAMSDPEHGERTDTASLFLLGRLDFYLTDGSKPLVPYFGAHAGGVGYTVDAGDGTETSVTGAYGGQVGLKFFISESTSWTVEGNLTQYSPKTDDPERMLRICQALAGFSYYF